MSDPYGSIPGINWTLILRDLRARVSIKRAICMLPLGAGALAPEGMVIEVTKWDSQTAALFGASPIAEKVIKAWAKNAPSLKLRVMPIDQGQTTAALLRLIFKPVGTGADPTVSSEGVLVFAINGERHAFNIADGTAFAQISADLAVYIETIVGVSATVETDSENPYNVLIKTDMEGSIANQTAFQWLIADVDFKIPANMKPVMLNTEFSGGTQSADLAEKLDLYRKYLRDNNVIFFSPYNEISDMEAINDGLTRIYDDMIKTLKFTPLAHITARSFTSKDKALQYRAAVNAYNVAVIPLNQFYGDSITEAALYIAGIWREMQTYRINNSSKVPVANVQRPVEYAKEDVSELLHLGLSLPYTDIDDGGIRLLRVLCAYKEDDSQKPIDFLTQLVGAIYVVNGVLGFSQALEKRRYLIVASNGGGNKITPAMIQAELTRFLQKSFVEQTSTLVDNIIEELNVNDIFCRFVTEDSIELGIGFRIINGLNKIGISFIQTIGTEE